MNEVTQTILHGDPSGTPGNCLQSAVASALDLDLDDVPHFALYDDWRDRLIAFAREHGHQVRYRIPGEYVAMGLAIGPSPRGVRHAVVWCDGHLAWDPHPDRSGLEQVTELLALERL